MILYNDAEIFNKIITTQIESGEIREYDIPCEESPIEKIFQDWYSSLLPNNDVPFEEALIDVIETFLIEANVSGVEDLSFE